MLLLLACALSPEPPADSGDHCPVDSVPVDTGEGDSTPPMDSGDSGAQAALWPGDACDPLDDRCGYRTVCCTECCLSDATPVCTAPAEDGLCPLPDLTILPERISASWYTSVETFAADDCAIVEGCVTAAGSRRLLRFDTTTPNHGTADLRFGNPSGSPLFHYSECHQHMHFDSYARYRLLNPDGTEAATGHKQAFCLMDIERLEEDAGEVAQYDCGHQGIQAGWADTYGAGLDCQWIDVTGVPAGSYLIEVQLNTERLIPENHYDNNVVQVAIELGDQSLPTDPCAKGEDGPGRECGWEVETSLGCVPGEALTVECEGGCDGTCEWDSMLRICAGADNACFQGDALANVDDTTECGYCPWATVTCPAEAAVTVLSGSYYSEDGPAACTPVAR